MKSGFVSAISHTLTEREARVFQLRFGLEDEQSRTPEDVGHDCWIGTLVFSYLALDVSFVEPEALFCLVSVVWGRECVCLIRSMRSNV